MVMSVLALCCHHPISAICTSHECWALHGRCQYMECAMLCTAYKQGSLTAHPLPLPPILCWSRMSSPTGTRDFQANTPTRQRTYPKPVPLNEHEFLLASNANPDAPTLIPEVSPSRSILEEIAVQLNLQENREEIVKSWNRFTRQKIGVIASLRALGLSSCRIYSLLLIIIKYWHHVIKGWIFYYYWYHWPGCPAFSDGHIPPLLLVMLIYHSTTKYQLIVHIQSLSLQLYPWSGYLIMEENRCHTIWVRT